MKIERTDLNRDGHNQLMHVHEEDGKKVSMGHVIIPSGTRFPESGSKANLEDEYTYIVQGKLEGEIAGEPFTITAGDFIHIPAGSQQWGKSVGEEDVHIVYTLIESM